MLLPFYSGRPIFLASRINNVMFASILSDSDNHSVYSLSDVTIKLPIIAIMVRTIKI